ncbi:hypothetical protein ACFOM8_22700 [Paracoccus angustae]|uniref:site-specific DNA-methyltransferase (adenine-specific) n=1 Tax=Paracoccus angustae TaxID=1671480 RepID=A0ABV7UAR0_9RHOB
MSIAAPTVNARTLIRSKERVKDLAEVFTPDWIVRNMLDLVGDVTHLPETTFLEPSCGNGNFLTQILDRKLTTVFARHRQTAYAERQILRSVMSIYAVDIDETNVRDARARLLDRIDEAWREAFRRVEMTAATRAAIEAVLAHNVRVCDFLNGRDECVMTEYIYMMSRYICKDFRLSDPAKTFRSRGPFLLSELPVALAETPRPDRADRII